MKLLAGLPSPGLTIPPQSPTVGIVDFEKLRGSAFPTAGVIDLKTSLTIGEIISKSLIYLFVIAGLILLFMLIYGGFQMMLGATNPKTKESASQTITNAILGFIILFISYWLVQILEIILGISILK